MDKFNKAITGLLGDPTLNLGIGLLAAGGRRLGPRVSTGQAIAEAMDFTNNRLRQQNALEAERLQIKQQKQQQEAIKRYQKIQGGLLSPAQMSNNAQALMGMKNMSLGLLNPQTRRQLDTLIQAQAQEQASRQAEIPGLLAAIDPRTFALGATQSYFSQPRAQSLPNSAREFEYAQSLPPEQQAAYLATLGNNPSALEQAQLAQILANTQATGNQRALETAQVKQDYGKRVSGRRSAFDQIESLLGTLSEVRGTAAETGQGAQLYGQGAGALSAVGRLLGVDTPEAKFVERKVADLNKGFAALATGAIPQAFMGSDNRLSFYADRTPSTDIPLSTNIAMLRQMARDIYDDEINARPVLNQLGVDGFSDIESRYQEIIRMIDELEMPPLPPGTVLK